MGVAEPARRDARDERVLGLVDEDRQGRFEQRHVDALAGPCGRRRRRARARERGQDPDRAEQPRTTSLIATPTLVGPPPSASAAPVIDISPPTAWMTKS